MIDRLRQTSMRAVGAAAAILVASVAAGHDDAVHDARCPWGRVADGKGKLVRCITEREAAWLLLKKTYDGSGTERAKRSAGASKAEDEKPSKKEREEAPDGGPGNSGENDEPEKAVEYALEVSVGPVKVDEGDLPEAVSKLSIPKDRYVACVEKHGGMFRDEGVLHVRFLVRQRGRAEGVHVVKRRSVTEAAGKCVADVVDRRSVGRPSAEMVGATLVVEFRRTKK